MLLGHEIKAGSILVIDDEPFNVDILVDILESDGFSHVIGVTDPVEGLQLYKDKDFDLVLLDINMPVLDGFQVMDEFSLAIKTIHPPILILTALKDRDIRLKALASSARDFLEKPFDGEEIICRVSNLLEMHLMQKLFEKYSNSLEVSLRERTRKIEETQAEILDCLAYAAEYRDMDTANHTIRVGWYSRIIAEKYGFKGDELDLIQQAAPMHDIGKIGVSDVILLKPGKLDKDEFEKIKLHAEIGAEILSKSNARVMKIARIIALTHHEKWNGKGYPKGLAGLKIPIQGRIVAIADVFDALSMERPYKKAWPMDKTLNLLFEEAGEHFDPQLVDIFMEVLPAILEIKDKYEDKLISPEE